MLADYLTVFYTTCQSLAPLIVPVFGVYLILNLVANLLFKE